MNDKPCVKCGKIAVVPPLCFGCMLDKTDDEYIRIKAQADVIDLFPQDEGSDCKMCGKPNVYNSPDGFCSSCRTIWNS